MKKIVKQIFYGLPSLYVLMFHHINDGQIIMKSSCILLKENFLKTIDSGLSFCSITDILKGKRDGRCAITFDDGLKDVYRVAYPELKKRGIPFTLFVVTNFLDQEGYLTKDELVEMSKDPLVTVGSHGVTHDVLKGMNESNQLTELRESKTILESIVQRPVTIFAYSHGQSDKTTLKLLKKYKIYKYVFGVTAYPLNFVTRRWKYNLPRINCQNGTPLFTVVKWKNRYTLKKI